MSRYVHTTDEDLREMLAEIGVGSVEELFADIPTDLRLGRPLDLPEGLSEQEVYLHLRDLAQRNTSADDEVSFAGGGMYDHFVPALVEYLVSRSEFLTPYTPYQPEISQGGLQAMFEYQTAISELTGLPISNASVYEGPSAVGAAGYLARQSRAGRRFVVSGGLHPHSRETLRTMSAGWGTTVEEVPLHEGATEAEALAAAVDEDTAAVFVQQPNYLGAVEDVAALAEGAKGHTGRSPGSGAMLVCAGDPLALAILEPPGACGVDIAVGEGQTLGNRLDFGGPSFGFFAATEEYLRRMPGRIAGETHDADGRRGFVLTLQTREQHIRREKATHNICTAQALNALAGVIYMSWLGRQGIVELAELMLQRTAYARDALAAVEGVSLAHRRPVVREFAVALEAPVERVIKRCQAQGVNPGLGLTEDYPELGEGLLVAVTEQRTRKDIDRLAAVLGEAVAAERAGIPIGARA